MTAPERKETQCPDCLSENAVPKEVAWDALTKVPRKTANDLQAALDRIAELEGALEECVEVLALKESPDFPDPQHHERVKALGQEIGFGALMSTASCGWRECAKEQGIAGSEFVAGPCYVTVVETLSLARAVLAKGDG